MFRKTNTYRRWIFIMSNELAEIVRERVVGFGSSIVGFGCYALSSSFHDVFGQWNLWKIVLYCSLSMIISVSMLFVNKYPRFPPRSVWTQTQVGFLVLMLTSLYSYHAGQNNGSQSHSHRYQGILSLVSSGAFVLLSMSLSRLIQP